MGPQKSPYLRIYIAARKHRDLKANWLGKGLFHFHFHSAIHHQRKSRQKFKEGRILEAGADTAVLKEYYLLACFLWLAKPTFL